MNNNEIKFIDKYIHLFEKAEKFGFSAKDFIYNPQKLRQDNSNKNIKIISIFTSFLFLSFITYAIINYFDKFLYKIASDYFEDKRCLLSFPQPVSDLLMHPIDCSFCESSSGDIKRLDMLNKDIFEIQYAYSGIPVIVTDATMNWRAISEFNIDFFYRLYSKDFLSQECQFFPYQTTFANLSEALHPSNYPKSSLEKKSWYIGWGNCDRRATEILRGYYTHPYFLPDQSESGRIDWIFLGYPGYGAPNHIDRVVEASWQAQISGIKWWRLEPPSECYFKCHGATKEFHLKKGEIIVFDTNRWYHSTKVIGDEISISIGSEYD